MRLQVKRILFSPRGKLYQSVTSVAYVQQMRTRKRPHMFYRPVGGLAILYTYITCWWYSYTVHSLALALALALLLLFVLVLLVLLLGAHVLSLSLSLSPPSLSLSVPLSSLFLRLLSFSLSRILSITCSLFLSPCLSCKLYLSLSLSCARSRSCAL